MKCITKKIAVVIIVFLYAVLFFGCQCLLPLRNDCCDIDLTEAEKIIDSFEAKGKIRHDQAIARKEDIRKSWNSYDNGELSCNELRQKIAYHTNGEYPDQ